MDNSITPNRKTVESICNDVRARVLAHEWKGKQGRTDWAVMLTALDVAQYSGLATVRLDARTMSFAAGVSPITASRSLRRLAKADQWLHRIPARRAHDAYAYVIMHPRTLPHMYKFRPPYPGTGGWEGEWWRERESECTCEGECSYCPDCDQCWTPDVTTLIDLLSDMGKTYTYGGTRDALLIGRTELGVLLGTSAVWVALRLTDSPQAVKAIALASGVNYSTVGKVLREKLAPRRLAIRDGKGWVRGIPLESYTLDPPVNIVGKRRARIVRERWEFHNRDMWLQRELERTRNRAHGIGVTYCPW